MIATFLTGLDQPTGPDLGPEALEELTAGLGSFLVDQRTTIRHQDGTTETLEPRGFAIHWQCCGKGLGTTYLMPPNDLGYGVGVVSRTGERLAVERGTKIRFRCPQCGRSPVTRGDRVLAMLVDLARRFPGTGVRRVAADVRILD